MRVLIVGINGFLGNALTQTCLSKGWDTEGVYYLQPPDVAIKMVEMNHLTSLKPDYDVVFLLAAKIPYGKYNVPDSEVVEANVLLVHTVCTHFPGSKIVYASSISVYGNPPAKQKITENTPMDNPPLYGLSKVAGEYIVRNHPAFSIIRYTSLYGKGMFGGTFLPSMIAQSQSKGEITVWGKGERKQDYIHVSDAAQIAVSAASRGKNEVYLGVSGYSVSNLEVARIIQELTGCEIVFQGEDSSPSFEYDASHTANILQFSTKISLIKGIQELL